MIPKQRFFDLAKKMSIHSNHHSHSLGAVIVKKNRVVAAGYNKICTHPQSNHKYSMLHAEISALIGSNYDELKNCTAYVFRQTKDGKPAMSKPCPSCEMALRLAGISKVFFTTPDNKGWGCEEYL